MWERQPGLETESPKEAARMVADVVRTSGSWGLETTFNQRGGLTINEVAFDVKDGFNIVPLGGLFGGNLFKSIEMTTRERTQPPEIASRRKKDQLVVMVYDIEPRGRTLLGEKIKAIEKTRQITRLEKELAGQTAIIFQTPKVDDSASFVAVTIVLPSERAVEVLRYITNYPRFGLDITDALIPGLDMVAPRTLDLKTVRIIQNLRNPFLPVLRERSDRTIEIPLAK